MQLLSKSQQDFLFLIDTDKLILRYEWKGRGPRIAKPILKMENEVGESTLSDIKAYCML